MFRIKSAAQRTAQKGQKRHMSGGFIKIYIFFSCLAFLVVACAYYIGKKIPSNEIKISDPVADRYEVAGVDLNENPSLDPSPSAYDAYGQTYERQPGGDPQLADQPLQSAYASSSPAVTAQMPGRIATTSILVFSSKINDRISFEYPADFKVTETASKGGPNGQSDIITFRLADQAGKRITAVYEKSMSGCFDPLRSFSIDPSSGLDYRILYPQKTFIIEEKYQAIRNDEESGRYADAGDRADRPLRLTSNVCAQTAVPTRFRISSDDFMAADRAFLTNVHDTILGKLTL